MARDRSARAATRATSGTIRTATNFPEDRINSPKIQELADCVHEELGSDRDWFRRNRSRRFRVRLAFPTEAEMFEIVGAGTPPRRDWFMHVLVEQVEPGVRFRRPFWAAPWNVPASMTDAEAADLNTALAGQNGGAA